MKYYNQKFLPMGDTQYRHGLCAVLSLLSPSGILEELRKLHEQFPSVRYEEHLERPMHNKYDFFRDGVAFGGAYVDMGKYTDYNRETKEFHLLPMFQLRVNPNKYMHEEWFKVLCEFSFPTAQVGSCVNMTMLWTCRCRLAS